MRTKKAYLLALSLLTFLALSSKSQAENNGRLRFAVMGCMHTGICDFADYEFAVKKIKSYHPDFVLFLGSMVDTVGEKAGKKINAYNTRKALEKNLKLSSAEVESLWRKFDKITAALGVPVYDVPSERSLPANNVAITEKSFLKRYKNRFYSFEYKNNLFICLDSEAHNRIDQKERGSIDGEQLRFLKNALVDTSKYGNVFIAMHKSAWHPLLKKNNNWLKDIHPIINKKVKYVFGACLHALDLKKIGEVNYITSGAAPCWPNSRLKPALFHFLMVEVAGEEISVTVVPLKPAPIENILSVQKENEGHRAEYLQRLTRPERARILQTAQVVKTLKVKPGMNILDIGAGAGVFAFPFAEALKGTGRVFATDIDRELIEYMDKKREETGYQNVFPVAVRREGVDPFYQQHSFDIIFLSNVYELLRDRENYFRQLRPSLAEENGRLYIFYFRHDSDFNQVEFDDFKKVVRILASKGETFPVFQRLDQKTKEFIRGWDNDPVPAVIQGGIIENLNKMLSDRTLLNDLKNRFSSSTAVKLIHPLDLRLANWLIARLDQNGAFETTQIELSALDKKRLRRLNRMILAQIFKNYKLYERLKVDIPIYVETDRIVSTLEKAGYEFIRKHGSFNFYDLLEFKRKY